MTGTRPIFTICGILLAIFAISLLLIGCHPIYSFTAEDNPSLQSSVTLEMHRALTITPAALDDPQQLIQISTNLISETTAPVGVVSTPIVFPSGEQGMFVALGYVGLVRGYQFLYRIQRDRVELVESRSANAAWGMYDFEHPSELEKICLRDCRSNHSEEIIKVVGVGHAGTGLVANGVFELVQVTDEGLQTIFHDFEENWVVVTLPGSYHEKYRYIWVNQPSSPYKVLVKEGQSCDLVSVGSFDLKDANCIHIIRRFTFDGAEYH